MASCQKCGAELPEKGRFCEYCGSAAETPRSKDRGTEPGYIEDRSKGRLVRFKRSSVTGMLFCTVLTMGLYPAVWYALRRGPLTRLDPERYKYTRWVIWGFVTTHALYVCSSYDAFSVLREIREPLSYINMLLWVCASFAVRGMLRRYAGRVSPGNPVNGFIAASEFCLFLFGFLYLQTQINRMIDARLLEAKL